jgi:hypothetical protein
MSMALGHRSGAKRRAGAPYPGKYCGSPSPQLAMGRIEHTLFDGEFSVRPNRPKTIACNPTIPQKLQVFLSKTKGRSPEEPRPNYLLLPAFARALAVLGL